MADPTHRWVGGYAQDLASGQMMGTGDFVTLSDEDLKEPHNKELLANGLLIPTDKPATEKARPVKVGGE